MEPLQQEIIELKKELAETKASAKDKRSANGDIGPFWSQLANEVTGLVGLREAILSRYWVNRCIWAILLLAGVGATVQAMYDIGAEYFAYPTVTTVLFEKRSAYDYPPLVFCKDNWIDTEKSLSNGLSIDALTYSLGYFNWYGEILNTDSARQEFLAYYKRNSFGSLLDYYKHLAIDPLPVESVSEFPQDPTSFFYCNNCVFKNITMEFLGSGICYMNTPKPAYPHSSSTSNLRRMGVILEDRTRNLVPVASRWSLNICVDFDIPNPQCRSVSIESSFHSFIQVSVSEYSSLDISASPCLKEYDQTYSAAKCWATCRNKQYHKAADCNAFWFSSTKNPQDPEQFCNFFDPIPNKSLSLSDLNKEAESGIGAFEKNPQDESCFEKCAYPCKRTAYQLTLESKFSLIDDNTLGMGQFALLHPNMSIVLIFLSHSAAIDGGVPVWTEVSTFSMSRFIGSVGGMLGLFVGGTVMTLAQVIFFLVNYCIERKVKNREK